MQTAFTLTQLAEPTIAESNQILRACVHCGFCTATCPTYVVLGDELDSPRGRIYLIKNMLESGAPPGTEVVTHIDRCLTCLACVTTCPASVDYTHLVGHARAHIAKTYRRPWLDRALRGALNSILPYPARFQFALGLAKLAAPLAPLFGGRLRALLDLARTPLSEPTPAATNEAKVPAQKRVALLAGCVQQSLAPQINAAATRLLGRRGIDVIVPPAAGCCGALSHHLSEDKDALRFAKANIDAWMREVDAGGLDAILVTTSGCGTMLKDYAHLLKHDSAYAEKAAHISSLAKDITEYLSEIGLGAATNAGSLKVAYHSACSLQHGQGVNAPPRDLLRAAGFDVLEIAEGHLCCGSAGIYNMLEPEISEMLLQRKAANVARTEADIVAAGNIGCITQIARRTQLPVVHTVELLDWATGGPKPLVLGPA